jgi:phosphoadenosine phosphosulfate reductase
MNLYSSFRVASEITDRVLVSYSGGKDSAVLLDLCNTFFDHIVVFFMYQVPGLSFQCAQLEYAEKKYKCKIIKVPHFELSELYRYGSFRKVDFDCPIVTVRHIYNYLRELTGIYWIAAGERIADSIWRRAMIKQSSSISLLRGRFYPLAEWKKKHVMQYVKKHRLKVSPESESLGFSFRSFMPKGLKKIRDKYPSDYSKIKRDFPLIDLNLKQLEFSNEADRIPNV